jgi:isopenicillin-N N-acyltransferase like protein
MKIKSASITALIMILFNILPAQACTLWAANGTYVEGGGSLIIKNRDWRPDHRQGLKLVTPETGYRYFGLFQLDGDAPGLRAGINEKGLVIISATAGSIPASERNAMPRNHGLLSKILNRCASVDAALAQAHWFVGPQFMMLADKEKVARIEIGPEGKIAVTVTENGVSYHTNHYLEEPL